MQNSSPSVYLAGLDVFRQSPDLAAKRAREILAAHNLRAVSPVEVPDPPLGIAPAPYFLRANIKLIDSARAVIAEITPFRGPHMDPGTAWEVGYAFAKGYPVVVYTASPEPLIARCDGYVGADGRVRDEGDFAIEDFGLPENLMIATSARSVQDSLESAARHMAQILQAGPQHHQELECSVTDLGSPEYPR